MKSDTTAAADALNRRFLLDYPHEAAHKLEELDPEEAAGLLSSQPLHIVVPVWEHLAPDAEDRIFPFLSGPETGKLLAELELSRAVQVLGRMDPDLLARSLARLDPQIARDLQTTMSYPLDSAGRLMDVHTASFRGELQVKQALERLRSLKIRGVKELFLVDDARHLTGRVDMNDLALADPGDSLQSLARPVAATVQDVSPREEVVETLEQHKLAVLPVVDFDGRLMGVIRQSGIVTAVQEEASLDIQTMVGVSKSERALSSSTFAVRKRLPWLQVNLLTAFLAASVVGLFEGTISRFTALAVLLPVVAGQSGNAGAQALAVTMRGLALREIGVRHWPRVVWKEVSVGFLNGVAIAITTAAVVFIWSSSPGLALVIGVSMVLSMVAAGFSGALIPITLQRLGQDPAQSSSIILTTVTDVVGFFSFLGIATALSAML